MAKSKRATHLSMVALLFVVLAIPANAANLSGVWTTNASQCDKIFMKKSAKVSFASNSDFYGSGFIVDRGKIKAKTATCSIKTRTDDGPVTNLVAACATAIMLIDVKFTVKVIDDNTITRVYPGVPELDSKYSRCAM